jgi:hypothetical protein
MIAVRIGVDDIPVAAHTGFGASIPVAPGIIAGKRIVMKTAREEENQGHKQAYDNDNFKVLHADSFILLN